LLGQGRLRHAQALGGASEMQLLGDSDKVSKLPQVDTRGIPMIHMKIISSMQGSQVRKNHGRMGLPARVPSGAPLSIVRTTLLTIVCLSRPPGATALDHPLYFEARSPGLFATRAAGQSVIIRPDRMELDGVTLRFVHPSKNARLEGLGISAPSTYITRGQTRSFRQYPKAGIRHVYPGIDVAFYGSPRQLEYDLDLARGATPDRIRIQVGGARGIRLDEQGNLVVDTRSGELLQLAPRVFQTGHGVRREIAAKYMLLSANEIGFHLGQHDRTVPLTIDPVIVYTKYFGGSGSDFGGPVATDAQGNVYVTGSSNSIDFPSTNGTKVRLQPPLLAFSNAGQTVTPLPVGTQVSVTAIGGTADGSVLYVATPDGIFVSGDHGASFVQAVPLSTPSGNPAGTVQAISVDAIDPSRAYIATTTGLFSMSNAGQAAGENDVGMAVGGNANVDAASVQVSAVNHAILYATTATPNFFYTSTDAGATWQQLNPAYPGEPAVPLYSGTSITFTLTPGGSDLYLVDGNANLLKSTDGGMTWQQLAGQLYGAKSITIDPNNPSNVYVVDNYGVQLSTNGGATFAAITPALPGGAYVQTFALDGTGALYFATYNQIEVSVDHGATWKILPPRPNPHVLIGLGNQVFAGVDSPAVPFIVKWSADGSQLLYSTFFGGSYSDAITAIAVDSQGEAIIAGYTASSDFPVTQTISKASPPEYDSAFVAKLSTDGSQAIYSSILGASQSVTVNGLAIDASGAPYITGATQAPDFPTTANAPQPKLPATMCQRPSGNPFLPIADLATNGFVSKLSADASSLVYSTFLTGSCGSTGQGIAVDSTGDAVVVGSTTSPDFPVTTNAYQSTFPGGSTASITYPNPIDFGFVSKLSAAGDKLIASSLIGGGFFTQANALVLDSSGDAYITGSTWGITPGATPGAYQTKVSTGCPPTFSIGLGPEYPSGGADAFVLKLDPTLSSAQYLTYLGGECDDNGTSIVLQPNGNVWVGGGPSQGFPLVTPFELAGVGSGFVSEFSADLSQLMFSSYSDSAFLAQGTSSGAGGAIYVAGSSLYSGGLHKNAGYQSTVSLVKIDPATPPPVIINSIGPPSNAVGIPSAFTYGIAPGELINIVGQHLGPSATVMAQLDATGRLPFQVSSTSVSFDGYVAPLISVQDGLIVCFTPFEITGSTEVTVTVDGQKSNSVRDAVVASAPYFLTITNQDGTANSASHPAPQGSVVTLYITGLGLTFPLSQDGSVSAPPLPVPLASPSLSIGGNPVQPQFVAAADGLVAGITQVNAQIPVATYSSNPVDVFMNDAIGQIYIGQ
jgi:uncharacterized protein (TIGR03437 family)